MIVSSCAAMLAVASAVQVQAPTTPPAAPAPATATAAGGSSEEAQVAAPLQTPEPSTLPVAPAADPAVPPVVDIVVTGRPRSAGDPLAKVNVESFRATQAVDKAIVGPLALGYRDALPSPIRSGLRNFLYNLHEPDVFLNFLLQLKPGKAAETLGRFVINSTIGVAGLIDVAKRRPFKLPRRANGFADTFGYYGIKPGPFLFLPLIGPTTPRDLVGGLMDRMVLPLSAGAPFNSSAFAIPAGVVGTLDHRAEFDETLHTLHDGPADPYTESRNFYLRRRQAEIDRLHGRPTDELTPVGVAPPHPAAGTGQNGAGLPPTDQRRP